MSWANTLLGYLLNVLLGYLYWLFWGISFIGTDKNRYLNWKLQLFPYFFQKMGLKLQETSKSRTKKEVGAGSYQPRILISKHRNPKNYCCKYKGHYQQKQIFSNKSFVFNICGGFWTVLWRAKGFGFGESLHLDSCLRNMVIRTGNNVVSSSFLKSLVYTR